MGRTRGLFGTLGCYNIIFQETQIRIVKPHSFLRYNIRTTLICFLRISVDLHAGYRVCLGRFYGMKSYGD